MSADAPATDAYAERTSRNRGLIEPALQDVLRRTRLVIAGCGSTGGACVGPLVRTGATRFLLVDPGSYELTNLNRQDATLADVGRNKAQVQAERVLAIEPQAEVAAIADGVTAANLQELLADGDVVIDAIDVTTDEGAEMKVALHRAAQRRRLPVVTAYDIGSTQFLEVFDYRTGLEALRGKVPTPVTSAKLLHALVPPWVVPREVFGELVARRLDPTRPFPQLAMTATQLGALIVPVVLRILEARPLRRRIRVDLWDEVRPRSERALERFRRYPALVLLLWRLRD